MPAFAFATLSLALLASLSVVRGAVTPTGPGPNDSYNVGAPCPIVYSLDTTGTWTNVTVDLMTGSNLGMVLVTNVASGLDGTTGSGTLSWECPPVVPNSAIYFYQFTNNGIEATWTTRFTIASATGAVTTPTNATQPGGEPIPWGTGRLVGAVSPGTTTTGVTTTADATTTALSTLTTTAEPTTAETTTAATTTASTNTRVSTTTRASAAATTTAATGGAGRVVEGGAAVLLGAAMALVV